MKRLHLLPGFLFVILMLAGPTARAAAPAPPEYVKVAWVNNLSQFLVRWLPVADAASYNVYRYDTNTTAWVPVANNLMFDPWNVCSFRDPSAPGAGPATYGVTAVNSDGEGPLVSASVVPGPDIGNNFTLNSPNWAVGYTYADPEFVGSFYERGFDGMMEASTDGTNFTHAQWNTNIYGGHRFHITNLTSGTRYYLRMTAIEPNDVGVTYDLFQWWIYTLPPPVLTANEEEPTSIQLMECCMRYLEFLTLPQHGVLEPHPWWGDPYYLYTSHTNFVGTDTFQIRDDTNGPPITVTINVQNVNDAPVAEPFTVYMAEDTLTEIIPIVTDPENDSYGLGLAIWDGQWGNMMVPNQTNFVFEPFTNFVGTIQFLYYAYDSGYAWSAYTEGTIIVTNINDAPEAADASITLHSGVTYSGNLLAYDVDGDALTIEILTQPTNGSLTISGTNFDYATGPGEFYQDRFTFRASDGRLWSREAVVDLQIQGPNTAPVATDQSIVVPERYRQAYWALDVADAEGDPLEILIVSPPAHGTLTLYGRDAWYQAANGYFGPDSFSYQAWDRMATGNLATVFIDVRTNTPPVAFPQNLQLAEDNTRTVTLTGADQDGDYLGFQVLTQPASGTLSGTAPNLVYRPATNFYGNDSFTFRVSDSLANSTAATISLTVTAVNDAPVRVTPDQTFTFAEDTTRTFTLQATDVEGPLNYFVVDAPANGTITMQTANTWRYAPTVNWNGTDVLRWAATDGEFQTSVGTITFVVTNVNDVPSAFPQSVTMPEGGSTDITLIGVDAEGTPLQFEVVVPPVNGSLTGCCQVRTYTPFNSDFYGSDSFTFRVFDGTYYSATATVSISITNVNDLPVPINRTLTMNENDFIAAYMSATDIDDTQLTYAVATPPAHGRLLYNAPFNTYIPDDDYYGQDSFTFTVTDNHSEPQIGTITININPVNDAPHVNSQLLAVDEDTPLNITLTSEDPDGPQTNYIILTMPTNGTVAGTPPDLVYTPNPNFHGVDRFYFRVTDGITSSGTNSVTIQVRSINDQPVADTKTVSMNEDTTIPVSTLFTASDADGDPLTYHTLTSPGHGLYVTINGETHYQPFGDFTGTDTITFKVKDGQLFSEPATVTINILPVSDPPFAFNQTNSVQEDFWVPIMLRGFDVDGDALTFTVVTPPQHGVYANGVYTPALNYYGPDSFTYKANDGQFDSPLATVSITVNPMNDQPVADSKAVTTAEDQSVEIALTGSDVEGSPLTFTVVYGPTRGTFANGVYTPAANYFGTDSFIYQANDGQSSSDAATVTITITAVNDAPVAYAQNLSTFYNTARNITLTGYDIEGSALTFTTLTSPANGTLTGSGANLIFTPNIGWYGTTSFTFNVNDGALDSLAATITIMVASPVSVPVAPSGLDATAVSQTQINLAWTDNSSNEDGFKIERATAATGPWTEIGTVGPGVTTYASTGLTRNKRYYYRVRAYNVLGNSAYSNTANAKTLN